MGKYKGMHLFWRSQKAGWWYISITWLQVSIVSSIKILLVFGKEQGAEE